MNIFILDSDIKKSVSYLMDKHLTKMPLETAQILCSPFMQGEAPYRRTHYNHPCCVWARKSKQNYEWLLLYGYAIFDEFETQRGKQHGSRYVLDWCAENYDRLMLPNIGQTPFAQAMPDEFRNANPIKAYRKYYREAKKDIATWKRGKPAWF